MELMRCSRYCVSSDTPIKKRKIYTVRDEPGIGTYLYREYALGTERKKIAGEISGCNSAHQSIVTTRCEDNTLATFGYAGICDAKLFNIWLKNKLIPRLRTGQIVMMDKASIYKSETI